MRRIGAAMLAVLAGCLNPGATVCSDGTVCPVGQSCTDTPGVCTRSDDAGTDSPPDSVCADKLEFDTCDEAGEFVCLGGQCTGCDERPDIAGCRKEGWASVALSTEADLYDVWMIDARDGYAVGDSTLLHYNGVTWEEVPLPEPDLQLRSVWAANAENVYIASAGGAIFHSAGGAWVRDTRVTSTLAIAELAGSGERLFAVGALANRIVLTPTETQIEPVTTGNPALHDVWAANDIAVAVGGMRTMYRWLEGSWASVAIPASTVGSTNLRGIWHSGATGLVVGDRAELLRYGSGTWNTAASEFDVLGSRPNLLAVWSDGEGHEVAVGDGGTIVVRGFDDNAWSVGRKSVTFTDKLNAVHGTSATNIYAVGERGRLFHYTGIP